MATTPARAKRSTKTGASRRRTDDSVDAAQAPQAPPAARSRSRSTVPTEGVRLCPGPCGEELPLTKFGTRRTSTGEYERDAECRSCRDARRLAKRAS